MGGDGRVEPIKVTRVKRNPNTSQRRTVLIFCRFESKYQRVVVRFGGLLIGGCVCVCVVESLVEAEPSTPKAFRVIKAQARANMGDILVVSNESWDRRLLGDVTVDESRKKQKKKTSKCVRSWVRRVTSMT